jgi:hypothetical protein
MSRHGKYFDIAFVQSLHLPPQPPFHSGPIDNEPADPHHCGAGFQFCHIAGGRIGILPHNRPAEIDDAEAMDPAAADSGRLIADEQQARRLQAQQPSLRWRNADPIPDPP